MLVQLHFALRRLLQTRGRLDPLEVDVRFEPPNREMTERLTRPAVSFYLFEISENTELRRNDFQSAGSNARSERRLPPRRIDLHYMVSAVTTNVEDEHLLLWRTLATLLKYYEIPTDLLPEEVQRTGAPVVTRTAQPDDISRMGEIWTGLGVEPHPAVVYVVTAPLDLDVVIEAPLVLTRTTRYSRHFVEMEPESRHHIGGVVRGTNGDPLEGVTVVIAGSASDGCVTDVAGHFLLANVPAGAVDLRVIPTVGAAKTVTFEVPGETYDIDLD